MQNENIQRRYRFRIGLFLPGVIVLLVSLNTVYTCINTLNRLEVVESERDRWQRPADVLAALDLREGNVVADLGSGSGYFTLKLSPLAGDKGQVLAVDIRRVALLFLRLRTILRSQHNVRVVLGGQENPHLPAGTLDAALICNAYHEFRNPGLMLDYTFQSLRKGGRLAIVDRGTRAGGVASEEHGARHHQVALSLVEDALRRAGFEILARQDRFIDDPGDDLWWLVVARKS